MIKIIDIADEIFRDLGQIPELSIAYISFWLQSNIGKLNNLILTNYSINPSTLEICPALGNDEKDIFKELFKVKFYEQQVQKFLYAGAYDNIVELADGDGKIRLVSKNDLAKTALALKKDAETQLIYLSHLYKFGKMKPIQVTGNDFYSPIPTQASNGQTSLYD